MLTIIRLTVNSNFTETISACLGCYGLLAPQFVLKSGNGPVFFCVCVIYSYPLGRGKVAENGEIICKT